MYGNSMLFYDLSRIPQGLNFRNLLSLRRRRSGHSHSRGTLKGLTLDALLKVNNIEVVYNEVILVLKGISLQVPEFGVIALLGANGAGKSTTLKAITGILETQNGELKEGTIEFMGKPIHKLDAPPLETGDPILTAANWYQTNFPPMPVDVKFNLTEEVLIFGEQKIVCLHTPGHTPGSICIYLDKDGKRILFGQDLHGPLLEEFGSNLEDYGRSTQKLLDLDADILCEGHFGIYKTKKDVREYIRSYRRQYGVE
jgi:ABC-type dipeptide/oligopeptide/nickel transport system ATPase component